MLKQKISGSVQEVILPDFPDDDNTVTATITKSRRVSFGPNFVKEFIVDSAVSAQCMSEYEQPFPSSDSSSTDSSHSAVEHSTFVVHENIKVHKTVPLHSHPSESESTETRSKPPKFASTICFSADSPTADMEFTEGCITLAKSILDKKNKEMTVFIQAKSKESKGEEKAKEEETNYFEGSQFEMSMTRCLKSKENKQEERRFASENTKIFSKYDDEMSMTRCEKFFNDDEKDNNNCEDCKENRVPLDAIMRHLDSDESDSDLFNPEKSLNKLLGASPFELSDDSEKLNLNESMEISSDFIGCKATEDEIQNASEKSFANECKVSQTNKSQCFDEIISNGPLTELDSPEKSNVQNEVLGAGCESVAFKVPENPPSFLEKIINKEIGFEEAMDISLDTPLIVENPTVDSNVNSSDKSNSDDTLDISKVFQSEESENLPPLIVSNNDKIDEMRSDEISVNLINLSKEPEIPSGFDDNVTEPQVCEKSKSSEAMEISFSIHHNVSSEIPLPSEETTNDHLRVVLDVKNLDSVEFPLAPRLSRNPENSQVTSESFAKSSEVSEVADPNMSVAMGNPPPCGNAIFDEKHTSQSSSELVEFCDTMEVIAEPETNVSTAPENPLHEEVVNDAAGIDGSEVLNLNEAMEISAVAEKNTTDPLLPESEFSVGESKKRSNAEELNANDLMEVAQTNNVPENFPSPEPETNNIISKGMISTEENDFPREPSLGDLKVIESLREQSKELECVWSLKDVQHPQTKAQGLLSFSCRLLESSVSIVFTLKVTHEDNLDSCSIVSGSEILLDEEKQWKLPEYILVVDFGFGELKKHFEESRKKVMTIRHIPYFLDQVNSFVFKMNANLRQIHLFLTSYPNSRLSNAHLSFRLFSFPIFFSCIVSIDLSNLFRLSKASLSFKHDFGCLDENKIRQIFEECLKHENSLYEFVVQSTKYVIDLEKETGYLSKRGHIRMLPDELKS